METNMQVGSVSESTEKMTSKVNLDDSAQIDLYPHAPNGQNMPFDYEMDSMKTEFEDIAFNDTAVSDVTELNVADTVVNAIGEIRDKEMAIKADMQQMREGGEMDIFQIYDKMLTHLLEMGIMTTTFQKSSTKIDEIIKTQ